MRQKKFKIGLWHPFGPHSGEKPEKILGRKAKETKKNGWTLWSFKLRKQATFDTWHNEIKKAKPNAVYVFCSDGKGEDPADKHHCNSVKLCKSYRCFNQSKRTSIPDCIKVPHTFREGGRKEASAFIVKEIIKPFDVPDIEWLRKGIWCGDKEVWRRGESLLRKKKGKSVRLPKFCAVLVLKSPYFAIVSAEKA